MKKSQVKSRETTEESKPKRKAAPGRTIEARQNQLIALAYDLVEDRLRNGTATSQETTHFLKLGSIRERKELEILDMNKELLRAKTDAIQSQKRIEELYADALNLMKSYAYEENDE